MNVAFKTDEDIQIALRAAIEVAHDVGKLEDCLQRIQSSLDLYESWLEKTETLEYENDYQWKRQLFDAVPIGLSVDQLRAILALIKSRPFLEN
jgi:hypothetical protein